MDASTSSAWHGKGSLEPPRLSGRGRDLASFLPAGEHSFHRTRHRGAASLVAELGGWPAGEGGGLAISLTPRHARVDRLVGPPAKSMRWSCPSVTPGRPVTPVWPAHGCLFCVSLGLRRARVCRTPLAGGTSGFCPPILAATCSESHRGALVNPIARALIGPRIGTVDRPTIAPVEEEGGKKACSVVA